MKAQIDINQNCKLCNAKGFAPTALSKHGGGFYKTRTKICPKCGRTIKYIGQDEPKPKPKRISDYNLRLQFNNAIRALTLMLQFVCWLLCRHWIERRYGKILIGERAKGVTEIARCKICRLEGWVDYRDRFVELIRSSRLVKK